MVRTNVVKNQKKGAVKTGESSCRVKRKGSRHHEIEEEEEPNLLNPNPAHVLILDHSHRRDAIWFNRKLVSSRWIDVLTINELGIGNSVEFLTSRIGPWNFLSEVVPTYKNITIEFLSTVEFNHASAIISFDLGGFLFTQKCMVQSFSTASYTF